LRRDVALGHSRYFRPARWISAYPLTAAQKGDIAGSR
jgi:hypothetical protein